MKKTVKEVSNKEIRKKIIDSTRRVVIKVGSRLLAPEEGVSGEEKISQLIDEIAVIRSSGIEVILVSSGAIGAGMSLLELDKRPRNLPMLQVCAAVGQSQLMSKYERACKKHNFHCGQLLLSNEDIMSRLRHLNFVNCLNEMLKAGIMPIINENDSLSVEEIRFGDNDYLASLVGSMSKAELTVLLTSTDGMYKVNEDGSFGERFSVIEEITDEIREMASGTDGNQLSTGGMISKINAAETVNKVGESLWIVDGSDFKVLRQVFNAEDTGTLLPGNNTKMKSQKRWLALFSENNGSLILDEGAVKALCNGKSLLPSGIKDIKGEFTKGDTLDILNESGSLIAKGISNYGSEEARKIKGLNSKAISTVLGYHLYDEMIHRDNLVILQD